MKRCAGSGYEKEWERMEEKVESMEGEANIHTWETQEMAIIFGDQTLEMILGKMMSLLVPW